MHLVPSPRFHFFQSHTKITYVTAHHTRNLYFFHIRCSNAVTTLNVKLASIHNNTISKFIPRYHYDNEASTFCEILKYFFLMLFKTVSHIAKHITDTPPNIGFYSYSKELVYTYSCYKFVRPTFTQES